MGCSPFGRLISMAFGGSGERPSRKRSRQGRRHREYSPQAPPEHVTISKSMLRTVVYRDDGPIVVAQPVHTIHPPATVQMAAEGQQLHQYNHPLPEADISPSPHVHAAAEHDQTGPAVAGGQPQFVPGHAVLQTAAGTGYRYAPSPVPSAAWWGDHHGERRREYFGAEYRYSYPTPMREGIYRMATDANRLTTMFSDENPNACSIS